LAMQMYRMTRIDINQ